MPPWQNPNQLRYVGILLNLGTTPVSQVRSGHLSSSIQFFKNLKKNLIKRTTLKVENRKRRSSQCGHTGKKDKEIVSCFLPSPSLGLEVTARVQIEGHGCAHLSSPSQGVVPPTTHPSLSEFQPRLGRCSDKPLEPREVSFWETSSPHPGALPFSHMRFLGKF